MKIEKNVREFMSECNEIIANRFDIQQGFEFHKTESPIEQILFLALQTVAVHNGIPFGTFIEVQEGIYEKRVPYLYCGMEVLSQEKIGKYRVDFLVNIMCGAEEGKAVVECDGHEFHEKTEAARRMEKKRDRELQAKHNMKVFRFTGSEIVNEPFRVALDVIEAIMPNAAKSNGFEVPD